MAIAGLRDLCTPAVVYFALSIITLIVIATQNVGYTNIYCLGSYTCDVSNTGLIFLVKFVYIIFWTWILNLICRAGAPTLSWILVLLPYILLFVLLGLMMMS